MSTFLSHEACDKCGSSDAKGIFSDGHTYCWSCGTYIPAKVNSLRQVSENIYPLTKREKGALPLDLTLDFPKEPYLWLKSYSLTKEEIENNKIMWSDSLQMLVFPYYGVDDDLLCWQGRYFPARNPKVYTSGYPDTHLLVHHTNDLEVTERVVVVEDAISAIKVSRLVDSSELLGSNLSMQKAIRLSRVYSHLTLWLDSDKLSSMIKFVERYKVLFDKVDFICTDLDPKFYSTEQLKEFLK